MADADDTGICDRVGNPDVQLPHGASYLRVLHFLFTVCDVISVRRYL